MACKTLKSHEFETNDTEKNLLGDKRINLGKSFINLLGNEKVTQ